MTDAPRALNPQLARNLLAYAAMAGAGVAACSSNAEAEVVYTLRNPSFCEVYYYQKWA